MKEEDKIRKEVGLETPFQVPDGYFGRFTSEIMNQLPQKEKIEEHVPTRWEKIRPWLYMTAMFVGAALIIRAVSSGFPVKENILDEETDTEMEYINMVVENSMMDDYSLYVYLTENEDEPNTEENQ